MSFSSKSHSSKELFVHVLVVLSECWPTVVTFLGSWSTSEQQAASSENGNGLALLGNSKLKSRWPGKLNVGHLFESLPFRSVSRR